MKPHYEFPFNLIMEHWKVFGTFGVFFAGIVLYNWFKAWANQDGTVSYQQGKAESSLSPADLTKNFSKHHQSQGKQVNIKPRKDGFDATTTDFFGKEEHYEVRKSRKKSK